MIVLVVVLDVVDVEVVVVGGSVVVDVLVVVVVGSTVVEVVDVVSTVVEVLVLVGGGKLVEVLDVVSTVVEELLVLVVVGSSVVELVDVVSTVVDEVLVLVVVPSSVVEVVDVVSTVVDEVLVLVVVLSTVVEVVVTTSVVLVVVEGAAQLSPAGNGTQTSLISSRSLRGLIPSGLFGLFRFTLPVSSRKARPSVGSPRFSRMGTTKSTCAPHADPVSSCGSMKILPALPFTPLIRPLPVALSSAVAGSQPSTPLWLMQTPTSKVQDPFGSPTPSASHAGSQSVHVTTCSLPSSTTSLASKKPS
jgi:hypothetical protein